MIPSVNLLLIADHASNYIPKKYDSLGLVKKETLTHKAYDLGVRDLAVNLSNKLSSQLVLGEYSRLLIDCNRDINDPTLISVISDRKLIEGNKKITKKERIYRINKIYRPYLKYHAHIYTYICFFLYSHHTLTFLITYVKCKM